MDGYIGNLTEDMDMSINMGRDGDNPVSIEMSDVPNIKDVVDCSDAFTTTKVFPSRDDMLNWARQVGKENGVVVVIQRSGTGGTEGRRWSCLVVREVGNIDHTRRC